MNNEMVQRVGETAAVSVTVSALLGYLPAIAAVCSIVWYGILFYDRFKRRRQKRKE